MEGRRRVLVPGLFLPVLHEVHQGVLESSQAMHRQEREEGREEGKWEAMSIHIQI